MGDWKSGGRGSDKALEVLAETLAAVDPREISLHHPSARQKLEAIDDGRPFDNFDRPMDLTPVSDLRAANDAVGGPHCVGSSRLMLGFVIRLI